MTFLVLAAAARDGKRHFLAEPEAEVVETQAALDAPVSDLANDWQDAAMDTDGFDDDLAGGAGGDDLDSDDDQKKSDEEFSDEDVKKENKDEDKQKGKNKKHKKCMYNALSQG